MRISIEKQLYMDCPEGFRQLTEEEMDKMNMLARGKGICIQDSERHIVISVAWTKVGALSAWLMGTRETAGNMAKHIGRSMKPFSYVWRDDVKRDIDGKVARGLDYDYIVQGIHMTGESLVVKEQEDLFYFHMYARQVRREESLKVFHDILDGVVIAE